MDDWTYSGDPSASTLDAVRFLSGDTSTGNQLISDSEITWTISQESSDKYRAAALVCEAIEAKYAQKADEAVGDLRMSYSKTAERYSVKAKTLRSRATSRGVSMYVGGTSISRKDSVEDDDDRVPTNFKRDRFDYDGSTGST